MISSTARRLSNTSPYATHGRPSEKALLRKARERRDVQHRQQEVDMARRRESRRHSRRSSIQQDRCHRLAVWLLLPNVVMIILGCVMTLCSYFEAIGFGTVFWRPQAHNVFHWLGPLILLGGCVAMFVNYMLYKRSRTGIYRLVSKRLSLPYIYDQMSHRGSCCHSTSASFIDPTSSIAPCSARSSFSLPRSPGSFTASASMWSATGSHLAVKTAPSEINENDDVSDDEEEVDSRKRILQSQDSSGWRAFSLDVVSWQEGKTDLDSTGDLATTLLSPRESVQGYHEDLRSPQFFTGKFKSIFAFEDPRLAEVQFSEDIRGFPDNKVKPATYKKRRQENAEKLVEQTPLLEERLIVDIPTEWIARTDFHNLANQQKAALQDQDESPTGNTNDLCQENPGPSHAPHTEPSSSKQTHKTLHVPRSDSHPVVLNKEMLQSDSGASPARASSDKEPAHDLEQFRKSLTELLMSNETICQNILRDVILKLKNNIDKKVEESPETGDASALHEMALRTLCSGENDTEEPSGSDGQSKDEVEAIVTNAVEEAVHDYLVMALVEDQNPQEVKNDQEKPPLVKNSNSGVMTLPDICRSMPAPGTSGESVSPGSVSADTLSERASSDKEWFRPTSPGKLSNRSSCSDVTKESKSQSESVCEDNVPQQLRRSKGVHFQIGDNGDDVRPKVRRTTPRLQRALAVDIKEKPKERYFRSKSQETKPMSSKEQTANKELLFKPRDVPKSPMTYREKAHRARSRMRHQLRPSMSMPVASSTPWSLSDAAMNDVTVQPTKMLDPKSPASSSRRSVSLEGHYDVVTSHHVLHALSSFPSIQADDIRVSRRRWSRVQSVSEGERRSVSIDGERTPRSRRTRSLEHRHSSAFISMETTEIKDVCSERSDTTRAFPVTTDAVFTESLPAKVQDKTHDKISKIESIDSYFRSKQSEDSDFRPTENADNLLRPKYSPAAKRRTRSSDMEYGRPREGLLQTSL